MYRDSLCPHCGRPLDVCTSHEETGPQFTASYTVCRATLAIVEMQRAISGKKPRPNAPAYLWAATIRER